MTVIVCKLIPRITHGEVIVYIGRGTPLGNPFKVRKGEGIDEEKERNRVCSMYEIYLLQRLRIKDSLQRKTIEKLVRAHKVGKSLLLQCHCKPKRCHGDFVKKVIENWPQVLNEW